MCAPATSPTKASPIAPLKYIASGQDRQCTLALERFMERYEPERLYALIDAIPEQSMGVTVLPEGFREYHKAVMAYRYDNVFVPAWKELHHTVGTQTDITSYDPTDATNPWDLGLTGRTTPVR